jgi:hypothetical protein
MPIFIIFINISSDYLYSHAVTGPFQRKSTHSQITVETQEAQNLFPLMDYTEDKSYLEEDHQVVPP